MTPAEAWWLVHNAERDLGAYLDRWQRARPPELPPRRATMAEFEVLMAATVGAMAGLRSMRRR